MNTITIKFMELDPRERQAEIGKLATTYFDRLKEFDSETLRRDADGRQGKGMAYVWGWQDRADEQESDVSLAFGYAYGLHAIAYYRDESCMLDSVQRAFARWCETGAI